MNTLQLFSVRVTFTNQTFSLAENSMIFVTQNHFLSFNSKIQKYSPTESAKVYDKAVNRKNNVHFHPRQTIDFISNNLAHATLTNEIKRRIVRQYLDVSNDTVLE